MDEPQTKCFVGCYEGENLSDRIKGHYGTLKPSEWLEETKTPDGIRTYLGSIERDNKAYRITIKTKSADDPTDDKTKVIFGIMGPDHPTVLKLIFELAAYLQIETNKASAEDLAILNRRISIPPMG